MYDIAFYLGCWRACVRIHNLLLDRVIRLPGHFFDTTPLGRILQRFSKDVEVVDSKLPELLTDWVICAVEVNIDAPLSIAALEYDCCGLVGWLGVNEIDLILRLFGMIIIILFLIDRTCGM